MCQQKRKKRKAATAGLIERLRKCCGIGTGEWKRTKGAALDLSKSGGEATCGGPFEKGGREEDEIEKREHKNHLHAMPKIVDAPLPQKFRSMRQFTAGRALHSPCPLLICTGLRNPLRSRLGARTTLPRVP